MPLDSLSDSGIESQSLSVHRPVIMGTRHLAVAGHYLAAHAGFQILEAGGNAVDAGVAAGIALGVLQSDMVNVAGVAPIILYLADRREVITISGLGYWPRAASVDLFQRDHGGRIPEGILRTVVPASPDAWITALEQYGTLSFADVAAAAIRFARDGFPIHPFTAGQIRANVESYRRWSSTAAIYLPGGQPPQPGDLFRQTDLGRTLQYMVDEETRAKGRGREAGLQAARDAFYKGDIASTIVRFHRENGGLLTMEDLAEFRVGIEPPVSTTFGDITVYACGPWCQGPVLPQALTLLEGYDLKGLGHNSPRYIHTITEALKLAFADRDRYYGDPRFVEVPMAGLLSKAYATQRRMLIRENEAWPEMPPAGDPQNLNAATTNKGMRPEPRSAGSPGLDTSYVCVVDRHGNIFSATPSDTSSDTPVIPGTGLCPSSRGSQSWADPAHASCVAPGKRPRLTPNPALALRNGRPFMAFGTPGGDVQAQAMLQAFLNIVLFGMDPQEAVEAPRFASYSFPDSFEPHRYYPGRLNIESRIAQETGAALAALGHTVHWWPQWVWRAGAVCCIVVDQTTSVLHGGADPRRPSYAVGW
jgi:gamma-glutamyltranspeptidase/glutathione hydrolase